MRLQDSLSDIHFMEGTHAGRSFKEVYEKYASAGYANYCSKTQNLAQCNRLYATYSTMRSIPEGHKNVNIKTRLRKNSKREAQQSLLHTSSSSNQADFDRNGINRIMPEYLDDT